MSTTTIIVVTGIVSIVLLFFALAASYSPKTSNPPEIRIEEKPVKVQEPKTCIDVIFLSKIVKRDDGWEVVDQLPDYLKSGVLPNNPTYTFYYNGNIELENGDIITDGSSYNNDYHGAMYVVDKGRSYAGRLKTLRVKEVCVVHDGLLVRKKDLSAVEKLLRDGSPFFEDKTFVLESNWPLMDTAKSLITRSGGKADIAISKRTSYLVVRNKRELPSKAETAKKYNEKYGMDIKIINFDELIKLAKPTS